MPFKDKEKERAWQKEYRNKTKDLRREYQKKYRELNSITLSKYRHEWYKNKRNDKLLKLYGITLNTVFNMLVEQDNKCSICRSIFTDKLRPYIDHCHTTLKVRGLLCMNCNTGLGHFKDNYKHLIKAARYVK